MLLHSSSLGSFLTMSLYLAFVVKCENPFISVASKAVGIGMKTCILLPDCRLHYVTIPI